MKRKFASADREDERRISDARAWARQVRAAEHRKRLKAIESGEA